MSSAPPVFLVNPSMQASGATINTVNSSIPPAGGADRTAPPPGNLQQQPQQQHQQRPITPSRPAPTIAGGPVPTQRAGSVGTTRRGNNKSWAELEGARDGLERKIRMAGTRLLLVTRADLAQAPFHASPEASKKFLRSLRVLRLHALATVAMNRFAAEIQKKNENSNHGRCVYTEALRAVGAVGDMKTTQHMW